MGFVRWHFPPNDRSTIRDKIIPHAVSWYTGEAVQDDEFEALVDEDDEDDDDDDDDDDEDDEDDDEDDDEEDEDEKPKSSRKKVWSNNHVNLSVVFVVLLVILTKIYCLFGN